MGKGKKANSQGFTKIGEGIRIVSALLHAQKAMLRNLDLWTLRSIFGNGLSIGVPYLASTTIGSHEIDKVNER